MQRAKFSLASVLWLFAASAAFAQTNDVSPNGAGVVSLEDNFSGTASLGQGAYIDVRNMAGSGVGYRNGYTQVGGFIPLWGSDDWFIAPQARLIITDTQRIGGNLGLVGRRYVSDWDRIIGANLFYDFDESYLNNRYNQVGFGFETLGEWLDVRGNVYLPTGGETNNMGPAGLDSTLYYIQNRLAVRGYDLIEQALKGGDVEFGVPVLPSTPWLRAFAGAYFYDGDGHDPVGVRGRVDANISNDLLVGLNVTHDNVYGTNLNAVVDFRFSGFLPTRYFPNWTTQERMLTQVQRNWRITTDQYFLAKDIPVINPRDDQPYFVVHIDSDNTGAGTGDGTAENPYHNLPGTVPNETDLVLVQRGQSTQAAPYTGNIQLVDYARMLGEGKAHIFDGYVSYGSFSQAFNDTVLPGFSNSGLYPFLSNPAGDIVTLASHNEVSAMVLQNASGAGIAGNGVSGFHLNNLEIAGNVGGGIVLQNAVGAGIVTLDGQTISGGLITDINRNTVPGYTPPAIGVGNNAGGGIVIDTGAAGLNLDIARVSMNAAAPGTQTVGIQLTADDGNLSAIFNDVQARGNTTAGIVLNQTGGTTLAATMTTVDVSANAGDGLQINGNGGTTVVGTALVPVTGLLADDNAGRGIAISGANAAQIGVALSGGSTQRSGNDGLFITGTGAGTVVDVSAIGNNLTDSGQTVAGAAGIDLSALAGADVTLTMSNSPAGFTTNANDDFGLMVTANAGTATANVTNGNFNNAGVDAVNILGTALGTANVNLVGTGGSDAGNDGIHAVANGGTVNLEVTGSSAVPVSFNGAGVNGFDGLAQNGGTLNMCLEYTTFNGSGDIGMNLLADGVDAMTSSLISANFDNVQVNGSQLGGLVGAADNFGELLLRAVSSQFNGNGLGAPSDGVFISADNDARALTLFSNSTAIGNSDDGYAFNADNGAYLSTRLDTITATGNAGYGVNFNAAGAGTDAYLISEGTSTISGNTLGNYNLAFSNTGAAVASLTGSFNGSAGNGVDVSINGAANALVSIIGDGVSDTIDGNAGNGVLIDIQNVAGEAGVVVSGYTSISNNGGLNPGDDGIHVNLTNVGTAAIDLLGIPSTLTTMVDNLDDGIEVNLTNVALGTVGGSLGNVDVLSLTDNDPSNVCLPLPVSVALNSVVATPNANGVLIDSFNISNTNPPNPGQVGILVTASNVSGPGGITISNNVDPNMEDGIRVEMTNNSTPGFITINDNDLSQMTQYGIIVTADSGSTLLNILNNTVSQPGDSGIVVDLSGTANYTANINFNEVDGASLGAMPVVGLNFLGSTLLDSGFIPPDTMGGVGINHIVEMLNGVFAIYDKGTGAQISQVSLNQFFDSISGITRGGTVFDPRIIYDPTANRWIATAIDGGGGNTIYIGVSETADPTGPWRGVQFVGDSVDGVRFNDYDTLGVDADGVYITTNNFGGPSGFDVSVFSIPKADLYSALPTLANMTRLEALNAGQYGNSIQAAVGFDTSDGIANLLSTFNGGSSLLGQADITGTGGAGATLSAAGSIAVPFYTAGPAGRQPGGATPVENVSPRFTGNVVEVNGSLWAVHAVAGTSGNSGVAWYEIDATTNAVIQSGLIEDPNVDYLDPSIAVNNSGDVVIGFTGGGPSQFLSSMAVTGSTSGTTTTFGTPIVLQAGAGTYEVDFGSGRNRWGDYSATVLDPVDSNRFWTFQELASGTDVWGVQITSLTLNSPVSGSLNDGIRVTLNDTAQLSGVNTISSNTVSGMGGDGIVVGMNDGSSLSSLTMNANSSQTNGSRGIAFDTAGGGTQMIGGPLNITGAGVASNNVSDGIQVNLNQILGTPDVAISGHTVASNSGGGIVLNGVNSPLGAVDMSTNTVTGNLGGDGILLNLTGALTTVASAAVNGNTLSTNAGDGLNVVLDNGAALTTLGIGGNTITGNFTNGINFDILNASNLGATTLTANDVTGHAAGDGFRLVTPDQGTPAVTPIDLTFVGNVFDNNSGGRGVHFELDNAQELDASFTNDSMSNNRLDGLFADLSDNAQARMSILSSATANTINGLTNSDISGNGGRGLAIETAGVSTFDLTIGGTGTANTFSGNGDAGVGIRMLNTGNQGVNFSTFDVSNASFTNTVDAADVDFNGEGFAVILRGESELRNATIGDPAVNNTTFSDNLDDGFALTAIQSSIVENLTIQNSTFSDTGAGQTQNNGVYIRREADAKLVGTSITGSTFTGNANNGIQAELFGGNVDIENLGPLQIDLTIGGPALADGNTITGNQDNGISLLSSADVNLLANIQNNVISGNADNGIQATSDFFAEIHGTWQQNEIDGNGLDGINLFLNRSSLMDLAITDNSSISNNGRDGIQVDAVSGSVLVAGINNNVIAASGDDGIDLDASGVAAIVLTSLNDNVLTGLGQTVGSGDGLAAVSSGLGTISISSERTSIRQFGGNGVTLQSSDNSFIGATFEDLTSSFNGLRGFEAINTDEADMSLAITGTVDPRITDGAVATSRIEQNGRNGIYVENNAGAIDTSNNINLLVTDTSIRGNGNTASAVSDDERNGVWIRVGTSSFGAVTAEFQRNFMSGNQNIDFVTQSFIATPDPGVASPYTNAANVVTDPVARLGLIFRNNEGNQIDVTRFGAFYNNADAFKSPAAFFDSTSRRRNAQRLTVDFSNVVAGTDPFPFNDTVQDPPAPATTTFAGTGLNEGLMNNNTFLNLGVTINGQTRDITAYNNGTNVFTVAALAAAPVAGNNFTLLSLETAGLGRSTFRTPDASLAAGGNVFNTVLSDFNDIVGLDPGNPDANALFGNPQYFEWSVDATPFTFEP